MESSSTITAQAFNLLPFFKYFLSLLISTILSSGILLFIFRVWIESKIKAKTQHKYDLLLESHKSELNKQSDILLEKLRIMNSDIQSSKLQILELFSSSHIASLERRLQSIDSLWIEIMNLRDNIPTALSDIDILLEDEISSCLNNPYIKTSMEYLVTNKSKIFSKMNLSLTNAVCTKRPFLGKHLFLYYWVYRTLIARIIYLLCEGYRLSLIPIWYNDNAIKNLLSTVLVQKEQDSFNNCKVPKLSFLLDILENKIITHIEKFISGETSADESLEMASKLRDVMSINETIKSSENLNINRICSTCQTPLIGNIKNGFHCPNGHS